MGCTDQESNFQYTFYRPEDDKWWCSTGYTQVYAAPKGYEAVLRSKISKIPSRMKVTFNSENQMWEARPVEGKFSHDDRT